MLRQMTSAIRVLAAFVVLFGFVFPLAVLAIVGLAFPRQAEGSLVRRADGSAAGSELIGQPFASPSFFHPRPSAAGAGYDATASAGTNLGPTSRRLIEETAALADAYRRENALPADAILPADAAARSASGLDPHISPANAMLQAPRVARARHLAPNVVSRLVTRYTEGRQLGLLGEPRVNVLRLNLALERLASASSR